ERGAAGVDAGDFAATLGEVQRKASLIGADVERGAVRVVGGGGVVEALVEEGSGLLAGGGIVVEAQAIDGEDRRQFGRWVLAEEWSGRWRFNLFQFADSGIGAFDDERGRKMLSDDVGKEAA